MSTGVLPSLKIWRTIKLGTGIKDANGFREAIRNAGMKISDRANNMLDRPAFTVASEETEIDLARVTVAELGFSEATRRDKVYERAIRIGLQLCPTETGPQSRLQYVDQPNGEWLRVCSEPILYSDGSLRVFYVGRSDSELWLLSYYADPGSLWCPVSQLLFRRPRK